MSSAEGLSPLDRVRSEEAGVARRIAGSREEARRIVQRARDEARTTITQARRAGERDGQDQYRRIILKAQDEVRTICLESQERAEELNRKRIAFMDIAVCRIVDIITAAGANKP
jgi:vacuolar-type H+-ATPase subunit H